MPMRLSIGPISIGDQVSLTGDADHFPARMRRSRMAVDNIARRSDRRKAATPNRHKEARDAMIDATIGVAHHAYCIESAATNYRSELIERHTFVRLSPCFRAHWPRYRLNDATKLNDRHPAHHVVAHPIGRAHQS